MCAALVAGMPPSAALTVWPLRGADAVAGYLPAAPELIKTHLLQLLAAGESVMACEHGCLNGTDFFMLRKSMLEPGWSQATEVSMVDFASELLGLSTLWLPGFYQRHSSHNFTQLAEPAAARG